MAPPSLDVSPFSYCQPQTSLSNFRRCRFVTLFWPKQVKASKLEEIHAKMVMKEGAPRQSSGSSKPRPTTSVKTNGSIPSSSSTSSMHRMNGSKPHRWNVTIFVIARPDVSHYFFFTCFCFFLPPIILTSLQRPRDYTSSFIGLIQILVMPVFFFSPLVTCPVYNLFSFSTIPLFAGMRS